MFYNCYSLQSVPLFNLSAGTTFTSMFQNCFSLQSVPLFNTAAGTNFSSMFYNCFSLQSVPLFNLSAGATFIGMFNNCFSLQSVPLFNLSAGTSIGTMLQSCYSLASGATQGAKSAISYGLCKLSKTALQGIFLNLGYTSSAKAITITSNYGADIAISKTSCGITSGSTTVTQTTTSSLAVGMLVTSATAGISTAVAVTFQAAGSTVTRTAHGLANGTQVSFPTVVTTTGLTVYCNYFVINTAANTFQVALTLGGAAVTLTNDGTGTMLYPSYITAINTNVSFTMSSPAFATASVTCACRVLDTSIATIKNWTITG